MAQTTKQLAANLDGISAKVAKLKLEMSKLDKGTTEYKTKQRALNQELKRGETAANKLAVAQQKLNTYNKRHKKSVDAGTRAQKHWNATQGKSVIASKRSGGALRGLAKRMTVLGKYLFASAGIAAGMALLNELFIKSAKRAIALEKAIADVGAVAGLTTEEMAKLKKVAEDTAGATSLTAIEVVGLQKELAKLGVGIDDISNLTKPIALLSQALGTSGAATAEALQKIQNQFGLTSEQANITANEIVGAVNESALNMGDLATAMQYVGPIARQAGLTFAETASMLGVLANNGFSASKAGTGLRTILIESQKAGVPFNEFMEELAANGISVADATEQFTKRGAAAAVTFATQYDEVKRLNGELEDHDRLLLANAKQMGSTQGQIDLLASAYDKASTRLGSWITNTEFFIELIEKLDPAVAGQARAYKALSNATDKGKDGFDDLTKSLISYKQATEGVTEAQALEAQVQFLREGTQLDENRIQLLKAQFTTAKGKNQQLTFSNFLQAQSNELSKDAGLLLEGIVGLAAERANEDTKAKITADAMNSTYADTVEVQEELNSLALRGRMTEEDKANALDLVQRRIAESTKLLAASNDLDSNKLYERRIKLYEDLEEVIENTANTESAADKGGRSKARFDLENYKIMRDERLQELADRRAFELQAAKTAEERNDIEIEYSQTVATVNREAAEGLSKVDAALYSNKVSIENTIDSWTALGNVTGEQSVDIFEGFLKGLTTEVKEDVKELGKLLKDGVITVDEYNERINNSIAKNKDVVKQGLASLVATNELTQEQADQLGKALDNVELDPKKKFQAKDTLLGRLLGVDAEEIIGDSAEAVAAKRAEELEKAVKEDLKSILGETGEIYDAFAQERLDNVINEAKSELDVIKERYSIEEEILKSSLNNQLITESQFRVKQKELKQAQLAEENAVNQKIFDAQKKQDKQSAVADGLEAAAIAVVNAWKTGEPITAQVRAGLSLAAIAASTGARVAAIDQRQFFPKKFEDGGMVSGPSHAEGGVPFSVQGRGGYEMEGGEFIINKRSASMHRELLERINSSGRTAAVQGTRKFAQGGEVIGMQGELGVEYLKVIAEGVATTNDELKKPTRAYVSSADLRADSRERSIRNNNDRV